MRWRRVGLAAALVAAALFATVAVLLWRDPYRVVLADYNRQRIAAGLSRDSLKIDDHRWVYAYADEAPAGAPRPLLLIVPRHPQRFDEVAALAAARGLSLQRRSGLAETEAAGVDVVLGDSMGEMFAYYAACDVAFVGGSLLLIAA